MAIEVLHGELMAILCLGKGVAFVDPNIWLTEPPKGDRDYGFCERDETEREGT